MLETFHHVIGQDTAPMLWWQMGARAIIIFFWAVLLYRLFPRRVFSNSSTTDVMLVVIVGSSLSRAMTGPAPLVPTIFATGLLGALYLIVMVVASRESRLGPIIKGRPIRLVDDGRINHRAMRRAQRDQSDLQEILRLHGVTDIERVGAAYLEQNGQVSIIPKP